METDHDGFLCGTGIQKSGSNLKVLGHEKGDAKEVPCCGLTSATIQDGLPGCCDLCTPVQNL
jgi:hypothetical protein